MRLIFWPDKLTEKHFQDIVALLGTSDLDRLYGELDGMTYAEVSRIKTGVNTPVNVELEATNVFVAWIGEKGTDATRQAVLTALEDCGNTLAKENLIQLWQEGY